MEIAMVGLGKMGANMVLRLLRGGHRVVAYDLNETAVRSAEAAGAIGARSLDEVVDKLSLPRSVWIMVPSGIITEETIHSLAERLSPGDTLLDGGNSNYKDSLWRAKELQAKGLNFIDVGTSGGVWGLTEGFSLMVGGDPVHVERHRPILKVLRLLLTRVGVTWDLLALDIS